MACFSPCGPGKRVYKCSFWDKATRGEEKSPEDEVLGEIQTSGVQDGSPPMSETVSPRATPIAMGKPSSAQR